MAHAWIRAGWVGLDAGQAGGLVGQGSGKNLNFYKKKRRPQFAMRPPFSLIDLKPQDQYANSFPAATSLSTVPNSFSLATGFTRYSFTPFFIKLFVISASG